MSVSFFCIIFFFTASNAASEESPHETLIFAAKNLQKHRFEEAARSLSKPFDNKSLEEKRLLLRAIAFTWMEEWSTARDELNTIIEDEKFAPEIFTKPVRLKDGPPSDEFYSETFSYDDVLYLWRTLWQQHIASRLVDNVRTPMEKVVRTVDYIFRHTQFGTTQEGFLTDKPFNVLIKGQGFCDEQSWILNQLLRAAGFDALRLLLISPQRPTSPHTISMVKIEDDWIPLDVSRGIILKGAASRSPKTFPQNFLINPTKKDYETFGDTLPFPINEYGKAVKDFGHFQDLTTELSHARPVFDFEVETYTPRFLWLREELKDIYPIPSLSHEYVHIRFPVTDKKTDDIIKWRTLELQYIFDSTQKRNAQIRKKSSQQFADLKPLRRARLRHLWGDLTVAEEMFLSLQLSAELTERAQENVAYYLGVIAFEREEYDTAGKRFVEFLKRFPATRWKDRVYYQQALIAYIQGKDEEVKALLKACDQTNEGSLFHWMVASGLIERQNRM